MARQTEQVGDGQRLPHDGVTTEAPDAHKGMTHMLFVDAIIGAGFPHSSIGTLAAIDGLALFVGSAQAPAWAWNRPALDILHLEDLQNLYTSLKKYEVTHAH